MQLFEKQKADLQARWNEMSFLASREGCNARQKIWTCSKTDAQCRMSRLFRFHLLGKEKEIEGQYEGTEPLQRKEGLRKWRGSFERKPSSKFVGSV